MNRHLDYPRIPYHGLLQRAAERWPTKSAIVFGDQHISFAEWNRHASELAGGLAGLGIERGDRIGLLMPNCPEYEIAFFGVCRAGAVPTPLNPSYKEREVRYQLADAGARAAIVHVNLLPTLLTVRADLPALQHVIVCGGPPPESCLAFDALSGRASAIAIGENDLAALPYSS